MKTPHHFTLTFPIHNFSCRQCYNLSFYFLPCLVEEVLFIFNIIPIFSWNLALIFTRASNAISFTVVFSVTFSLLRENIEMHFGKKHLFWKLYLFKTQHDSC